MKIIRYWEHYNERTGEHTVCNAYIVDAIPSVGDHVSYIYDDEIVMSVQPALMDCEQPTRGVWDYDFYEIEIQDAENEEDIDFIVLAVKREEECKDETIE